MKIVVIICFIFAANMSFAEENKNSFTLSDAIGFALRHNPALLQAEKDVEIEKYGVQEAKAGKMPKINFLGGVTRYRYDSPITPISGSPLSGAAFPKFDNTIYDVGLAMAIPLYRGGRLDRAVTIEELRKSVAEDMFRMSRQELVYNLTIVFDKIFQLEKLLESSEASIRQLEAHKKNVELFLKAGTVPRVELLKTETELAHAKQHAVILQNSIESVYELLKIFMGLDDREDRITVLHEEPSSRNCLLPEESMKRAFSQRPDYRASLKRLKIAEERIKFSEGKRLPSVHISGEYMDRSGEDFAFKENWNFALRVSVPIFDGGVIRAEINRRKGEFEKVREEQRTLRHEIVREINNAYLHIENAQKRTAVAIIAIESAKENLRIENLKYETGSGTSTDVIDAQTLLLRAETDYWQAVYDNNIALASLKKAVGEDKYEEGALE